MCYRAYSVQSPAHRRPQHRCAEFMRQITQHFDIEEIGPGEELETLLFDGIEIEPLEDN